MNCYFHIRHSNTYPHRESNAVPCTEGRHTITVPGGGPQIICLPPQGCRCSEITSICMTSVELGRIIPGN